MGEAILARSVGGANITIDSPAANITRIIANGQYTCTKTGTYRVICVGAGGGGGGYGTSQHAGGSASTFLRWGAGGGSGYINEMTVFLNRGDSIPVTVGAGGSGGPYAINYNSPGKAALYGGTGGTTSFGTYLSATGGTGGNTGLAGSNSVGGIGANNGMGQEGYSNRVFAKGGFLYFGQDDFLVKTSKDNDRYVFSSYGSGGNGSNVSSTNGQAGGGGFITIYEIS